MFKTVLKKFLYGLVKILFRPEIKGKENLPPDGEACIICGNHIHALDAPVFLALMYKKQICFMGKEELFKNKFLAFFMHLYGVFPVSRGRKDTDAIKKSLQVIKDNKILGIFPEGTRNGLEKGVKPKNGAVNFAIKTGVKIIPFSCVGTFKPFTKVKYNIGKPMDFSGYKENAHDKEVVSVLTNELMAKIVELRDEDKPKKIEMENNNK